MKQVFDGLLVAVSFVWAIFICTVTAVSSLVLLLFTMASLYPGATNKGMMSFEGAAYFVTFTVFCLLFSVTSLNMLARCVARIER